MRAYLAVRFSDANERNDIFDVCWTGNRERPESNDSVLVSGALNSARDRQNYRGDPSEFNIFVLRTEAVEISVGPISRGSGSGCGSPGPFRTQGSEPADRVVYFPRTDWR